MKFKHKELIIGIVIGVIISCNIAIFADDIINAVPNQFKIMVNNDYCDIEGYNINDSTYFKLRDIGKYTNFNVDFKEDTIMITTSDSQSILSESNNEEEQELYNYITIGEKQYIAAKEVDSIVCDYFPYWVFAYTYDKTVWSENDNSWCYLNKLDINYTSIEEYKIPCEFFDDVPYIAKEVFESEVLSRLNE